MTEYFVGEPTGFLVALLFSELLNRTVLRTYSPPKNIRTFKAVVRVPRKKKKNIQSNSQI